MLLLITASSLLVFHQVVAQSSWLYGYSQPNQNIQRPYPLSQMGTGSGPGFATFLNTNLGTVEGHQFGNNPFASMGVPLQPPRMQLVQINLMCETGPSQQSLLIRWIRQDSVSVANTQKIVAEGHNSVDPQRFAVELQQLPNGLVRSILTLLRPEPEKTQAAYFCQSSLSGLTSLSREVCVIGNRQFVNANMAYYAADTFNRNNARLEKDHHTEAVQVVTPGPNAFNETGRVVYH